MYSYAHCHSVFSKKYKLDCKFSKLKGNYVDRYIPSVTKAKKNLKLNISDTANMLSPYLKNIPNLQQVTEIGDTTNKSIYIYTKNNLDKQFEIYDVDTLTNNNTKFYINNSSESNQQFFGFTNFNNGLSNELSFSQTSYNGQLTIANNNNGQQNSSSLNNNVLSFRSPNNLNYIEWQNDNPNYHRNRLIPDKIGRAHV